MKILKLPRDFVMKANPQHILTLDGIICAISCDHPHYPIFLQDHLLLFVLEGEHHFKMGDQKLMVRKHECILLKKHTYIESLETANPENGLIYNSIMFFLKDQFVVDFLSQVSLKPKGVIPDCIPDVIVQPVGSRMLNFLSSLYPFFGEQQEISPALLNHKMLELLHHLYLNNDFIFSILVALQSNFVTDLTQVINQNYLKKLSLQELAVLSGRSLSSFRRDFVKIYQCQPARWIQVQRLEKARELLLNTTLAIGDLYEAVGFENFGHFSKAYKNYFGCPPSAERHRAKVER